MNKILLIMVIGCFAACNENVSTAAKQVDSTEKVTIDSLKNVTDSSKSGNRTDSVINN